jgi:hypothetical protein
MLTDMQNTKKTAGETAQTKKGWGIAALISAMVACTCFGNMWVTGLSVAAFGICAYIGGYMDEATKKQRNNIARPAAAGEREAA